MKDKRQPYVAIEVSPSQVRMVVLVSTDDKTSYRVQSLHVDWLHESVSVDSDEGIRELSASLSVLANKARVAGYQVDIVLSGAFCISRRMEGNYETVDKQLLELEDRSVLFRALGSGDNVVAVRSTDLDSRRRRAFVTVVNKSKLYAIVRAIELAGFKIGRIEHSLITLFRAVGQMIGHVRNPAIVVHGLAIHLLRIQKIIAVGITTLQPFFGRLNVPAR